jgi:excisionase family DNA binding protein
VSPEPVDIAREIAREIVREFGQELAAALRATFSAPPPGLLPEEELATSLRVSRKTIKRLVAQGLPARRVGSLVRYDLVEVKAWLKSRDEAGELTEEPAPRRLGRGRR